MWSVDESCRPNYRRFRPPEDTRYDEYTEWTKICDDKNAVIAFICDVFYVRFYRRCWFNRYYLFLMSERVNNDDHFSYVNNYSLLLLRLAPLRLRSATGCQQPPEWSVLGQVDCFGPWQPVAGSRGRSAPSSSRSSAVVLVVYSNTQKARTVAYLGGGGSPPPPLAGPPWFL